MTGVSVVVPIKGRSYYLEKLLQSIEEAKKSTLNSIEVIVVDSSENENKLLIESLSKRFQAIYYYLKGSVSEARNYGIKVAKFQIVLFVDSDCEVEHNLFNEHGKCYTNEEIGGCVGLTEFRGKKTWLWRIIEKMPYLQPFQWAKWKTYVTWGPCTNISFRKEALKRINGFESIMVSKECGEDVDLGYRITASGYKICCNPNAKVYHTRETWAKLSQFIERTFRFGKGEYYLIKKHPENIFFDIPKNSLVFSFLMMLFTYKALTNSSLLLIIIPFIWLLVAIFIQSLLALKAHLFGNGWKDIADIYASMLFDFLFELGAVIECVRKGDLGVLPYRFIYIEDQLLSRWNWGVIKIWSFVMSLFFLLIVLSLF